MQTNNIYREPAPTSTLYDHQNYDLLRVYAYYRTLLSSLLWLMFSSDLAPNVLGTHDQTLFSYTALGYTLANLLTLALLWQRQFTPRPEQIFTLLFIDICAITLLMHASGGIDSGLGYLLVICVAAGSIFISGQISVALAALASILVIVQSAANAYTSSASNKELFSAGSLGILLFITSLAFRYLTNKIHSSNIEIAQQTQHAAHLERLAQLIVERMRTGILVVNKHNHIELHNLAASRLLNLTTKERLNNRPLSDFPDLDANLKIWQAYPHSRSPNVKVGNTGRDVKINFARLDPRTDSDILIFLEDSRLMAQEAQQLKLASLGRLTASIAHEIRNPLGAISHASQLLNESPDINSGDHRLAEIIYNHSQRVNHIIENILQLSRRKNAQPALLDINRFLSDFVEEFCLANDARVELDFSHPNLKTKVDASQLNQILTNLCENGLRYSAAHSGKKHLTIVAGLDKVSELPFIDVIDDGKGIAAESLPHIFEPFFTTETTGTGLGLYISKELCEANQASLHYKFTEAGKSCFRIDLAHHQRIF